MSSKTDVLLPESLSGLTGVTAGFSGRHGGVSTGPFGSMNLGLSTGDDRRNVLENRRRFFHRFGIQAEDLAIAGQVHGSEVKIVSEPGLYPGYDAIVTSTTGLALCITAADCAVILMVDPKARVAAACHSGWRGTVAEIVHKTIDAMRQLDADSGRVHAYVGPCISTEHFEVGEEVAAQFDETYVERRPDWKKPHIDLKTAIRDQLAAGGVPTSSIEVSDRCTFAETDAFYSYRAEGGKTGRMMGFICLHHE